MRLLRETGLTSMASNISPSPSSVAEMAKSRHVWKSPVPYLFGSLALMLLLIVIALVLLVFSYYRAASCGRNRCPGEDDSQRPKAAPALDLPPKLAVIMAGDNTPTYLATPVLTVHVCSCDQTNSSCDDKD